MHNNKRLLLLSCLLLWLLGLLQHSFAQDQPPTTSTAATDPLLLNATKINPYNASLSRRQPLAAESSAADGLVWKTVFFCTGRINGAPHFDCPPDTCYRWYNHLEPYSIPVMADQPGTNCIDTDCATSFKVCTRNWRPGHAQHCKTSGEVHRSENTFGRCSFDVPGTEYIYLSV